MKRRWIRRVVVCLILGVVMTVAVAWGCAVLIDVSSPWPRARGGGTTGFQLADGAAQTGPSNVTTMSMARWNAWGVDRVETMWAPLPLRSFDFPRGLPKIPAWAD